MMGKILNQEDIECSGKCQVIKVMHDHTYSVSTDLVVPIGSTIESIDVTNKEIIIHFEDGTKTSTEYEIELDHQNLDPNPISIWGIDYENGKEFWRSGFQWKAITDGDEFWRNKAKQLFWMGLT